ncbi:MAG: hypothetical protein CSA62_11430 [Planctomycetota bacterium]|nr:MAG: hypothetical protein CSA62_11430 [Planctomycetota bacterium]
MIEYDLDEAEKQEAPQPEAQGAPEGATNVILYAFLRHYRLVLIACLIGGLIGFFQGATKLNVYRSEGTLWLQAGMREQTTVEQQLTREGRGLPQRASALVQAELELLRSSELLGRVVDKLGTDFIFHVPDPAESDDENTALPARLLHSLQSWWIKNSDNDLDLDIEFGAPEALGPRMLAIEFLREKAQLFALGESGMIRVAFETLDPIQVMQLINVYLEEASKFHTEFFAVTPQQKFVREELEDAAKAYEAADEALKTFKAKHSIYDLPAQESNLQDRIAALQLDVFENEVLLTQLRSQIKARKKRLEVENPVEAGLVARVTNPDYTQLRTRRESLAQEIATMTRRTGAENRESREEFELRRQARLRVAKRMDQELDQMARTILQNTPRKDALLTSLDTDSAQAVGLESSLAPKRKQLKDMEQELVRIQGLETQYETRVIQRSQALETFNTTNTNLQRISRFQRLDDSDIGNLRIQARAELPGEKVGPKRAKSLLFGLILGGMFGFALAFGLVASDPLIRRPSDLLKLGSAKGLALLPSLRSKERKESGFPQDSKTRRPDLQVLADKLWPLLRKPPEHEGCFRLGFLGEQSQVGNSEVAAAAAYGLATRTQSKVLVIETASSPTGIAHRFGVERSPGLHEVERGELPLDKAIRPSGIKGLDLLCAGEGSEFAPGTFAKDKARARLARVSQNYDYVVFDLESLQRSAETRHLLWDCNQIILVARQDRSRKDAIIKTRKDLQATDLALSGVVLSHVRSSWPFWLPVKDPELRLF